MFHYNFKLPNISRIMLFGDRNYFRFSFKMMRFLFDSFIQKFYLFVDLN